MPPNAVGLRKKYDLLVRVCHTCQYGSILPARATRTKAQCRATQPISTQLAVGMSWVELSVVVQTCYGLLGLRRRPTGDDRQLAILSMFRISRQS